MKRFLRWVFRSHKDRSILLSVIIDKRAEKGVGTYATWWQILMMDLFKGCE